MTLGNSETSAAKPEKLASTEIAQSRARFEKLAEDAGFDVEDYDYAAEAYCDIEADAAWRGHQWAERDTRERCAQLCDEILLPIEDWAGTKKEFGQKLCTALAERIRGKV